jgi:Ca-activated chloride channel homolog
MLVNSITFVLAALAPAGMVARETAQFTSGVNVVEVYATVVDAKGNPAEGLKREDFEVRENGEPQAVSAFAAGDFPLTVAVALDRSFSMAGERLSAAKAAARLFLGELRPEDEAAIVAIGSEIEVAAPLSTHRQEQLAALDRIDAFGTTGLHDAIIRAIEITQAGKGRRTLILLSDGDDRYSTATPHAALEAARKSDVLVYPIALGRSRPPLFAELAALTGGRSEWVRDSKTLGDTLTALARELRRQYLLGYTPARPPVAGSGEWRSITVTVKRPGFRVRARDGYLVK